ncbi:lipopolysaccharide heptosyltransferase I, partial [Candidatus Dependentiae bacterium]|nr:lipopolysaccharide heptosyltransferase I [Candidatus Dependentiae bacterium]
MTKILVIDWGLIGDVINHSMVYSSLKQKYPDSRIVLITKPYNYELFKNNPHIDKIFILEKKTHKSLSGQYGFFNNIKLYITV